MSRKEQIRERMEEEREKLNQMAAGGGNVEETYRQSIIVDRLIERYLDCEA